MCVFPDQKASLGFTMLELIMVILLAGILAAIAIPKFANQADFDARGFYDQTVGMVRYAQKLAIAQRRDVWVQVNQASGYICLTYVSLDANCPTVSFVATNPVTNPVGQQWYKMKTPNNVSFGSSISFSFNALGRPSPNVLQQFGVNGVDVITVESETGYVH